ncbi:MAG: hypothetical protein ACRD68_05580, partial [Pyrinomonadaceae bacterium]
APPTILNPKLPAELEQIIDEALEKDRERRYQTASDLLADLNHVRPNANRAQAASAAGGHVRPLRKYGGAALVFATVLSIAAAGAVLWKSGLISSGRLGAGEAVPARKMTFTALTTAGNVNCAAISPDGNYVAYATTDRPQMSSLWLVQPASSSRRTIIPPAEVRYHALTFSPDGNFIYYVAVTKEVPARTLYRVPVLGGPTKKLLEKVETAVSFSPDGARLAFRRSLNERRQAGLFIADSDGAGEKEVAAISYPETFYDPAWSPDGKLIACAAGYAEGRANMYPVVISVGDWTVKPISAERWQWVGQMAWLADASGLLMVARDHPTSTHQVWRVSYPGGEARRVTNDSNVYNRLSLAAAPGVVTIMQLKQVTNVWLVPAGGAGRARQITFGAGGYRGKLSWTPDGRIVYDSESGSAPSISVMDADGSNQRQLTGDLTGRGRVGHVNVSPDGRYVVFASDMTSERHVWRMNIDGSNPVQLTDGSGEDHPHCSPDGRWVVFTKSERRGSDGPTLWKVPIDGGEPVQLTNDFTAYPAVSPDGKMIACLRADGPGDSPWRMAVYPFEGGPALKVFPQGVIGQAVRWTPDGRGLTYAENHAFGSSRVWIQPLDGGQPRRLVEFETERIFGLDWSRDGRYLACVRGLWTTNVVLIRDFE